MNDCACDSSISFPQSLRILISVRDMTEFRTVMPIGVDVIDFKEPRSGPLAPVHRSIWSAAVDAVTAMQPAVRPRLSAALGDAADGVAAASSVPWEFDDAKLGPGGCATTKRLWEHWDAARSSLPPAVRLIAVAYADHHNAGSPPVPAVLEAAAQFGFTTVLIDSFDKSRWAWDEVDGETLVIWKRWCRRVGPDDESSTAMDLMLAGRLDFATAGRLAANPLTRPTGFGFRGAACGGNRVDSIDPTACRALVENLRSLDCDVSFRGGDGGRRRRGSVSS